MTTQNHNPDNLTDWGQSEGWRLLTVEEMKKPLPKDAEYFDGVEVKWNGSSYRGEVPRRTDQRNTTYRTREPLPSQPSDDLSYYETELPKVIAGVRRGEKWEVLVGKHWVNPVVATLDYLFECIKDPDFRVRLAPVPVVKAWDCRFDVPGPVCWIGWGEDHTRAHHLVVNICEVGVWIPNGRELELKKWDELNGWFHSTDRINWHPCVKPEGGK